MTIAAWLLSVIGPVAARCLTYLGIGILTLTGVDVAFGALVSMAQAKYGALPSTLLGLCGLAGIPEALGIIFGAFNARLALWIAQSSTKWVTKAA